MHSLSKHFQSGPLLDFLTYLLQLSLPWLIFLSSPDLLSFALFVKNTHPCLWIIIWCEHCPCLYVHGLKAGVRNPGMCFETTQDWCGQDSHDGRQKCCIIRCARTWNWPLQALNLFFIARPFSGCFAKWLRLKTAKFKSFSLCVLSVEDHWH